MKIKEGSSKFAGNNDVELRAIINNRKYIISDLKSEKYQFQIGGYYKVIYWCKNPSCARVQWSPHPIDTFIVFNFFSSKKITYNDSLFNKNVNNGNTTGGGIKILINRIFGKSNQVDCGCK